MGTDQMTPAECMKFARLAGELSVSGEALESCAATIARLTAELAKHQPQDRPGRVPEGGGRVTHIIGVDASVSKTGVVVASPLGRYVGRMVTSKKRNDPGRLVEIASNTAAIAKIYAGNNPALLVIEGRAGAPDARLGPPTPIKHAHSAKMEAGMDITCRACSVTVAETDDDQQTRHRCAVTGQYVALDAPCGLEGVAWILAQFFSTVAVCAETGCGNADAAAL